MTEPNIQRRGPYFRADPGDGTKPRFFGSHETATEFIENRNGCQKPEPDLLEPLTQIERAWRRGVVAGVEGAMNAVRGGLDIDDHLPRWRAQLESWAIGAEDMSHCRDECPPWHNPNIGVYFIEAVGSGRVKIGFTWNHIQTRMAELQTGCPFPLRLVKIISHARENIEREFHKLASEDRQPLGEWFEIAPCETAEIFVENLIERRAANYKAFMARSQSPRA